MKINTVDTVIECFQNYQNIFRRSSVELLVREISRLRNVVAAHENDFVLLDVSDKLVQSQKDIAKLETQLKSKEIVIEAKQQIINKLASKMLTASQYMIASYKGDMTVDDYLEYLRLKEQSYVNKHQDEYGCNHDPQS